MSITPKAIQDLLDELEASKQSRLRAWNVLQRLRLVLSDLGNVAIPPPAQKTLMWGFSQQSCHQGPFGLRSSPVSKAKPC